MNASSSDIDMNMMEAEPSNSAAAAASVVQDDVSRGLLAVARQFVDQGKPTQALQTVLMAMKSRGGEGAVIQILERARELYRNKLQASSQADQLASLFAECAIAEAQPERAEPCHLPVQSPISGSQMDSDAYKTSILAETGRKQIVLDALGDGSSFICLQCGGLVSVDRKDEHYAYWCQF